MKRHIDPTHKVHPVVSTMMPENNEWLKTFIHTWIRIKNRLYLGNAGLQLSINSTDEGEREETFQGHSLSLWQIAKIMDDTVPVGRKFTLNFPVCHWEIDPKVLLRFFNPEHYIIKLTPMHKTSTAIVNEVLTKGDYTTHYTYEEHKKNLEKAGYQVLVFIASRDEDESMITCGNAILSGKEPSRQRTDDLKFQ
jgi:23S rRNA (adenine2503-C2)-methyltransferase